MDVELRTFKSNGNDGTATNHASVTVANGDGAERKPDATERDSFLTGQAAAYNNHDAEAQRTVGNTYTSQETSSACRVWNELSHVASSRVRLWMILLLIFIVSAIILISMAVCSAVQEDADEKFDPSSFQVPLHFNGSFQLPNRVFTEDLFTLSSNESQALADDLREQLADLYRTSPALGRYFSRAEIYALRNGSVIADYQLTFLLPDEQQNELRNFTLSREMVYNVLRQSLYDQETERTAAMYIHPLSLSMY